MSLVSCPRVRTLISKLHTPGFAKYWPNGAPRWKLALPVPLCTPLSPPLLKERPRKLLLSCKTFLSLGSPVVVVNKLRLCLLVSFGFESNASDGRWCLYGAVWLKGNRAGELALPDCAAPRPALGFVAAFGVCAAFPSSGSSWLVEERQPGSLIGNARPQTYLSFTFTHSCDHSFKYLLSICAGRWRFTQRPDPVS